MAVVPSTSTAEGRAGQALAPSAVDPGHGDRGQRTDDELDSSHVVVIGRVTTPPQRRTLPSGDEVVALGLSVRRASGGTDAVPVQVGPAPPAGSRRRSGHPVGRRSLADAERLRLDDRVRIVGSLRRRWWTAGSRRIGRLEVTAVEIRRLPATQPPQT